MSRLLYLRRVTKLFCGSKKIKSCILRERGKIRRCISSDYKPDTSLDLAMCFLILLTLTVLSSSWDLFAGVRVK